MTSHWLPSIKKDVGVKGAATGLQHESRVDLVAIRPVNHPQVARHDTDFLPAEPVELRKTGPASTGEVELFEPKT